MPKEKKVLVECRLNKRLNQLHFQTFREYREFIFSEEGHDELVALNDAITTNLTHFFREVEHFHYLNDVIIPTLMKHKSSNDKIRLWSAGCSTGEEPYSIAFFLEEYLHRVMSQHFYYKILATDISRRALKQAIGAVYNESDVIKLPKTIRKRYFMKSRDPERKLYKIVPEIRKKIHFTPLNFNTSFTLAQKMDVIFCRNVMIYFNREFKDRLLDRFCNSLNPGGFLVIGHSDSLENHRDILKPLIPGVYQLT